MDLVALQQASQRSTYGIEPAVLRGAARADYVRENVLAATEELHELMRCFDWKPWHPVAEQGRTLVARQAVAEEIADVLIFLCNLAATEMLSWADVERCFELKVRKNQEREDHAQMSLIQ